jgi:hypothetical protein
MHLLHLVVAIGLVTFRGADIVEVLERVGRQEDFRQRSASRVAPIGASTSRVD